MRCQTFHFVSRFAAACLTLAAATACSTAPAGSVAAADNSAASAPSAPAAPAVEVASSPAAGPMVFDDEVTLDNGHVYLGISPRVGRVVSFGPVTHPQGLPATDSAPPPDLIWTADADAADHATPGQAIPDQRYINFGGDKLWVAPQHSWARATGNSGWPPEGVIDGQPWKITQQTDTSLTLQSQPSPHFHVVATRRFELLQDQPQVKITNTLLRTRPNPFPVQAWTITQVRVPRQVVMDIAATRPLDETHRPLTTTTPEKTAGDVQLLDDDSALAWDIGPEDDAKIGTLGRWIAAVYDHHTFLQRTDLDPDGAYPDASNLQTYRGAGYVEIETLGPAVQLTAGQSTTAVVHWHLLTHDTPPTPTTLDEQQD